MAGDEVAAARQRAQAAPSTARGRRGSTSKEDKEKRPPLWRWFSTQVAHTDPAKAAAARAIRERWDLPTKPFRMIDRALASEESEHLTPFRELLDEYRVVYGIGDDDEDHARETGLAGLMVPFAPEKCESCKREAIPGTGKCARHGGQWISTKDQADLSRHMVGRLMAMSESALRVLQDLMDNGRSEQVRMMAATAVLDRAGIGPHMNVNHSGDITVHDSDMAATELRARLDRLASNITEREQMAALAAVSTEVVEAEVVEG